MPFNPENPIHKMSNSEFATLVENTLLPASGGRDLLSHTKNEDGTVSTTHPRRGGGKKVDVETEASPDDPLGPPKSMVAGLALAPTAEDRKSRGLRPTLKGGITGSFGEMHHVFMNVGKHYGRVLDLQTIGNDAAQNARINALVAQWSDSLPSVEKRKVLWEKTNGYPEALAAEFATLTTVPLALKVDGKTVLFHIPNAKIGLEQAPLAHVLFAAGKNGINLSARPTQETAFITQGVANFSRILMSTDMVYNYVKSELEKQGVKEAGRILQNSKLGFDSARAEQLVLAHVPMLQLSDVISSLLAERHTDYLLAPLLEAGGETTQRFPSLHNAEHGARLLEALLYRLTDFYDEQVSSPNTEKGTTAKNLGLDTVAIKRYLRQSALDAPMDVAKLAQDQGVQKLLQLAKQAAPDDDAIERAVKIFETAVVSQKDVAAKHDRVRDKLLYMPGLKERALHRITSLKPAPRKLESNVLKAMDSGINDAEMGAMMREVIHIMSHGDPESPDRKMGNFSEEVERQRARRAERAQKDVPPLP